MLESFLAKYGYIAILLGTVFEGETIMIMGGFSAHRGYLDLLPWVVLAGFAGNFIHGIDNGRDQASGSADSCWYRCNRWPVVFL
jgi:hypothetical protein